MALPDSDLEISPPIAGDGASASDVPVRPRRTGPPPRLPLPSAPEYRPAPLDDMLPLPATTPEPPPSQADATWNFGQPSPRDASSLSAGEFYDLHEIASQGSEEEDEATTTQAILGTPPWLISAICHMLALLALAMLTVPLSEEEEVLVLDVVVAEEIGEQPFTDDLELIGRDVVEFDEPAVTFDMTLPENLDPVSHPPVDEISLEAIDAANDLDEPFVSMALQGRDPGMKKSLLVAFGGTDTTERSVRLALEWLSRNQSSNGSWSMRGPYEDGAKHENRPAATGMALIAFLGAGHTCQGGAFQPQVAKGVEALLAMQDTKGSFVNSRLSTVGAMRRESQLYAQAIATIALCELYGLTLDEKYREAAQRAIDYAAQIQSPEGGWRYHPGRDSDTSVTGWFVMALQSARMAQLEVSPETLDRITKYLDSVSAADGSRYRYRRGAAATPTMTAEGLLCRQYGHWRHDDDRLRRGADYLLDHPIDFENQDTYYWYYATQVLHHLEGDYWDEWNGVMREQLPAAQVDSGDERGSWSPSGDKWAKRGHGGRLYTTCLSTYMLEVYYRHLPIYMYRMR